MASGPYRIPAVEFRARAQRDNLIRPGRAEAPQIEFLSADDRGENAADQLEIRPGKLLQTPEEFFNASKSSTFGG